MKRLIPIVLILAAGVAAWLYWSKNKVRADADRIEVSGNIELTEVDISFKVAGKLVERSVDEGAKVRKGMLIARMDQAQTKQQEARDKAALDSAQAQLTQMKTLVDWQRSQIENDLAMRNAELKQAQSVLDELLAGSRKQDIEQAHAAVADVQSQNQQARLDWDRAQTLYKNEDISTQQRDLARTRFESTSALLRQAQERLALIQEGPRKEDIEAARAQVARARAAIALSETNRLELRRKQEQLVTQQAEIGRARAQLGITQTQLDDTSVYSPVDGVILVKSAEVGEVLAAGTTVVTVGDLDHPWLRAYVGERDLGRVKLGQKVKLTTDSFPGKVYRGTVSFIASEAEFTPKQIQTKEERVKLVYRIKIDVDNPNHELKSNMPVDAVIQL